MVGWYKFDNCQMVEKEIIKSVKIIDIKVNIYFNNITLLNKDDRQFPISKVEQTKYNFVFLFVE